VKNMKQISRKGGQTMVAWDVSHKSLNELIALQGRNAVVTGGARGIGKAIALRLAEAGANVIIGDIHEDRARETAQEIARRYNVKASGERLNVTEGDSIIALADHVVQEYGGIDIWVNNAGTNRFNGVLEIADEAWDNLMDINLRGTFVASREAAKRMIAGKREGVIINIVSTAGLKTSGNPAHYVASKHGIAGLTKSFAVELAREGIRVIGIAPTIVETPLLAEFKEQANEDVRQGMAEFASRLPLGRAAMPDDIARVVLFAASDLAKFMTGVIIPVDGGETAI